MVSTDMLCTLCMMCQLLHMAGCPDHMQGDVYGLENICKMHLPC